MQQQISSTVQVREIQYTFTYVLYGIGILMMTFKCHVRARSSVHTSNVDFLGHARPRGVTARGSALRAEP